MSAISAIGGIQSPIALYRAELTRAGLDAAEPPKKVEAIAQGPSEDRGFVSRRSVFGDAVAAGLAARSAAQEASPDASLDQMKRALISRVFKIDGDTDIKSLFGDIEFSNSDLRKAKAFMKNLEPIRGQDAVANTAQTLNTRA